MDNQVSLSEENRSEFELDKDTFAKVYIPSCVGMQSMNLIISFVNNTSISACSVQGNATSCEKMADSPPAPIQ